MRISHPLIMRVVKKESFIAFCLSNRNRLIEQYDSRRATPIPERLDVDASLLLSTTEQESAGDMDRVDYMNEKDSTQKKTHAEELFGRGLMTYFAGEDTASKQKAIELLTEALKSEPPLPHPKEIFCHMHIGNISLILARGSEEIDGLTEQDMSNLPNLNTAITELETALSLDFKSGERNLGSRLSQALILQPLDYLWMSRSIYIKKQQGPDSELAYLQDKLKKIEYLNTSLPGLCLSFSYHYGEANNKPLAVEWLRRAVDADTYSDVEETRTLAYFKIAQGYKNQAQQMLQSFSSSPEKTDKPEKTGGCFIATAAYGSLLAPEVMILRQFRDEVLLSSKIGRAFIDFYYFVSPPLALLISKHEPLQELTRRFLLEPILYIIKKRRS